MSAVSVGGGRVRCGFGTLSVESVGAPETAGGRQEAVAKQEYT